MILTIICLVLAACYGTLLLIYFVGWQLQPNVVLADGFTPVTRISIIIPARNESLNIAACIQSILDQKYPKHLLEILIMDDHSEDDTAQKVLKFDASVVRLFFLKNFLTNRDSIVAFKKKALGIGIENSTGELIVTTDADCIAPALWLANIAALYERSKAKMIVAPVAFTNNNSLVTVFQSLDFMTMQGITAAAQRLNLGNMSNGANLAFSRAAYDAVNGYEGVDHFASGDDYLLMVKIRERYPDGIAYLKSKQAIIRTTPQPDWASFLQQRIRWASKIGKYKDHRLTAILLVVYLFNVSLLILFVAGCFQWHYLVLGAGILLAKIILEILFLLPVSHFFDKRKQLLIFPLLQPLHILYICMAGFLGWKGKFHWKGREVK